MKIINYLTAKPARFFLVAAILWFILMCFLNTKDGSNFAWHDILVEANGMTFDLLVFGILLSVYEALREKRDKIERLHEEIEDYRQWDEKEALFRIEGAIKRLLRLGIQLSEIDLKSCYLSAKFFEKAVNEEANLKGVILKRAYFNSTNLQKANLPFANLQDVHFIQANLKGADFQCAFLQEVNFEEANLIEANFQGAVLKDVDFQRANLEGAFLEVAILHSTNFQGANLQGAIVGIDWFEMIESWKIIGIEDIKEKYIIDEKGILRLKST